MGNRNELSGGSYYVRAIYPTSLAAIVYVCIIYTLESFIRANLDTDC